MTTIASRRCRSCGALLASTSRRDRLYCTTSCRVAAHRRPPVAQGAALTPPELERLSYLAEPAIAESALVTGITLAAREDWRAAAWVLARRWPQRWASAERSPVTGARVPGGLDDDPLGEFDPNVA